MDAPSLAFGCVSRNPISSLPPLITTLLSTSSAHLGFSSGTHILRISSNLPFHAATYWQRRVSQDPTARVESRAAEMDTVFSASKITSTRLNVLITGSSKGIGYALAKEFLRAGDNVLICARSAEGVKKAVQDLTSEFGEQRAWGTTVDVRDGQSVGALVTFAKDHLGNVDIWINNAGSNAYTFKPLVETSDDAIMEIVETNTVGVMICCREAIKMLMGQRQGGHIFNMDGAGADGRPTPRFAAYGATKRSVVQLTKSLQAELRMQGIENVGIHLLSPGMVVTDLLMSGSDTPQAKFFINILAEPPETVARFLVPKIRAIPEEGKTRPAYIRFLTAFKAYSQILARLAFNSRKNRHVLED